MTDKRSKAELLADYIWYSPSPVAKLLALLLLPLSLLFWLLATVRKAAFALGFKKTFRAAVPLIVVGNIHVGGTGKTPFIISLLAYLKQQGFKPAVVTRAYGVELNQPVLLSAHTTSSSGDDYGCSQLKAGSVTLKQAKSLAAKVGDEAAMIYQRSACPVACFPNRARALELLLEETDCDVIVSDDGLQHYAMLRDIEIVLVDALRQFGNGLLMPAGPLRETKSRLKTVDFVVENGGQDMQLEPAGFYPVSAVSISSEDEAAITSRVASSVDELRGQPLCFVTGIGNPQRFFSTLEGLGLQGETRIFADHHAFSEKDFAGLEGKTIVMTEKDAVKCGDFAKQNWWYLAVEATLDQGLMSELLQKLNNINVKQGD